jgi:hypothetical protein
MTVGLSIMYLLEKKQAPFTHYLIKSSMLSSVGHHEERCRSMTCKEGHN